MNNLSQKILDFIYNKLSNNTAQMLIITGAVGWALSSMAQITAIAVNKKISDKEKSFLIPQELADAAVNIAAYIGITLGAKNIVSKMFKTGKITTPKVKQFLNENITKYKDKIGKIDFCLDNVLRDNKEAFKEYKAYSTFANTAATIAGGIVATNIVTPILRNRTAANVQKKLIAEQQEKPKVTNTYNPTFGSYTKFSNYSNNIRI